MYDIDALQLLNLVRCAQPLGFTLVCA